jgi:hypothetical protein
VRSHAGTAGVGAAVPPAAAERVGRVPGAVAFSAVGSVRFWDGGVPLLERLGRRTDKRSGSYLIV